MTWKDAITP